MAARLELEAPTVELVARQSRTDDGSESVADQVRAMRAECERLGWTVGGVHEEADVSGQRPLVKRKGLRAAVEEIEAGRAQVVMVAYFDRLCRNLRTQLEVVERVEAAGGRVQIAGGQSLSHATPTDRLTGSLLGAVAEYVALTAGERTAITKQRNIDAGIPPFPRVTPAYRRRPDGRLELDPERAPLIREAVRMRLSTPAASYAQIASYLRDNGIAITPGGVEALFASRLLVGEIHFGSFTPNLKAIEEPLLDQATFRALNATRASRGRYSKSERLLARLGVLCCGTCGARMTVNSSRGAGGSSHLYYRCGARSGGCPAPASVPAIEAETYLRDEAIRLGEEIRGTASLDSELERARLEREQTEQVLDDAIFALRGRTDRASSRAVLDELEAAHAAAVDRHERLLALSAPARTVTLAQWDKLTPADRRDAIRAVIASATVAPGRGPGRIRVFGRELLGE